MERNITIKKPVYAYILCMAWLCLGACTSHFPKIDKQIDAYPSIYPDYVEVTIPPRIAPLCFGLQEEMDEAIARFSSGEQSFEVSYQANTFQIPMDEWEKLLGESVGESIQIEVAVRKADGWYAYRPFEWHVSPDSMDSYLAYRRIAPGYELWNHLGIYQRDLTSFEETPIVENYQTGENCMNCHSFCNRRPDLFLFHMRQKFGGTYLVRGKEVEKLNTKTPETISDLVYPSWHPGGRFIAFSTNTTRQFFHPNDPNRIEVYDMESDVVVYDSEKHELVTAPALFSKQAFETFPTFSADGKRLYFCSAEARNMPQEFRKVKYSLCSIAFDPETRTFGTEVDTLYSALREGRSVSFPRVSPDGRFLLYTLFDYGNFSIWHKEADLYLLDLQTGQSRCLTEVNSPDVESYHAWSSNGRWIVFSSRRGDGLYTRPYLAHISEEGRASKPFVLPQKTRDFYVEFMQSYNIPEFVQGRVEVSSRTLMDKARTGGTSIAFQR